MIYYFLLIGYYRLFLHKYRRHIFHQKVSAGYQPYIENRGKDKGLCSGLPEFVDTGFRTQGSHGHCQQESIYIVDKGSQALRQQIERIETDDSQKTDSNQGMRLFHTSILFSGLIAGWDTMKLVMSRTGTSIITRIIFTIMATSEIFFAHCVAGTYCVRYLMQGRSGEYTHFIGRSTNVPL